MNSQSHFLSILLIAFLASFSFSFSSNAPEDPLVLDHHHHQINSSGVHDEYRKPSPTISRTSRLAILSWATAAYHSASAKNIVVNVDNFGAKGDGGDDSQVTHLNYLFISLFLILFLLAKVNIFSLISLRDQLFWMVLF